MLSFATVQHSKLQGKNLSSEGFLLSVRKPLFKCMLKYSSQKSPCRFQPLLVFVPPTDSTARGVDHLEGDAQVPSRPSPGAPRLCWGSFTWLKRCSFSPNLADLLASWKCFWISARAFWARFYPIVTLPGPPKTVPLHIFNPWVQGW